MRKCKRKRLSAKNFNTITILKKKKLKSEVQTTQKAFYASSSSSLRLFKVDQMFLALQHHKAIKVCRCKNAFLEFSFSFSFTHFKILELIENTLSTAVKLRMTINVVAMRGRGALGDWSRGQECRSQRESLFTANEWGRNWSRRPRKRRDLRLNMRPLRGQTNFPAVGSLCVSGRAAGRASGR